MKEKKDIRLLSKDELTNELLTIGEKKFRANQIWEWLWQKGTTSFDDMTNLSKNLRILLSQNFEIKPISEDLRQNSNDGTIKLRFRLHDGYLIESVLIPVKKEDRYTVCVSTQVGCNLKCTFCATGQMGLTRNLDPGEIYDQFFYVNRISEEIFNHPLTNVVYMGMGEPLLNYKNVIKSIQHITSEDGFNLSWRRITISTVGISKMIVKMAEEKVKFNLAISLHAATDEKRNRIMPINHSDNIKSLYNSLFYFYNETRNKITYEYIMFKDFNDSIYDAKQLAKLCAKFPVKVNIIEYNPVGGVELQKASGQKTDAFAKYLDDNGVRVTVRRSRGKDIDAACGQLANN